jgi:hypothetical protein
MRPPGQVSGAVRRGESLQLRSLIAAVGVREPVHHRSQIMPEKLPQPRNDDPLVIRHRADAERAICVGCARTVGSWVSHPPNLIAPPRISQRAAARRRTPGGARRRSAPRPTGCPGIAGLCFCRPRILQADINAASEAGNITAAQAADLRVAALENHLAAYRHARRAHLERSGRPRHGRPDSRR